MAKVKDFKYNIPSTLSQPSLNTIDDADIIIMGDSFFNVSPGYQYFPAQIQKKTGLKIHNYNIQGSGELWRKTNPIDYLIENKYKTDGKKRILILESVDRGLMLRFGNIEKPTPLKINKKNDYFSDDRNPPEGKIELIKLSNNHLRLEGWGADDEYGSPLKKIEVLIDSRKTGQAIIGYQRPDIKSYFKNEKWSESGWSYDQDLNLKLGKHSISVIFYDNNENKTISNFKYIYIKNNFEVEIKNIFLKVDNSIKNKLKSLDYLLLENNISLSFIEFFNTIRFRFFKIISPLTPKYSLNPKILFYKEEVNFYDQPLGKNEIQSIASNIKYIAEKLRSDYKIEMIFIPMPTKYSVYHNLAGDFSTNYFFRDLFKKLNEYQVDFVDLYTDFNESNKFIYFPSDTHWNKYGIEIGVNKVIEAIENN